MSRVDHAGGAGIPRRRVHQRAGNCWGFPTLRGTQWDPVSMYPRKLIYIQLFTVPVVLTLPGERPTPAPLTAA